MSQDPERMKQLIAFKKRLEDRFEALNCEAKETQATLDMVNQMLLEKGFKRGDIKEVPSIPLNLPKEVILPKQESEFDVPIDSKPVMSPGSSQVQVPQEREHVIPLKTMNDEALALIYFDKDSIHVMPDESKRFSVNTPPFLNFLIEKVLSKMKEKDAELVRSHQLASNKAFSFDVVKEEDLIREIIINNVDDERLKELKSSIRWTLEKMYEKMKS